MKRIYTGHVETPSLLGDPYCPLWSGTLAVDLCFLFTAPHRLFNRLWISWLVNLSAPFLTKTRISSCSGINPSRLHRKDALIRRRIRFLCTAWAIFFLPITNPSREPGWSSCKLLTSTSIRKNLSETLIRVLAKTAWNSAALSSRAAGGKPDGATICSQFAAGAICLIPQIIKQYKSLRTTSLKKRMKAYGCSSGQAGTPLGAPSLQYEAASPRCHSCSESVLAGAFELAGLISSFHDS